jgi:O-antigen ligase
MEKDNRTIQTKLYWVYLAGFFIAILQLINIIPPWFTPTDWGKAVIFRIIISILAFLFAYEIVFKRISIALVKEKIKSVYVFFWLLISFWGIYLLATIFSLDPHFSLWGNPQRNGGFVNFTFYVIFALLTFLIIRKKDWQKIWNFSIIVGIIVCLVAIFQQFGLFGNYLVSFEFRPVSTMGNAIFLSLYLTLLTFLTISFGLKTSKRYKKVFYLSSAALFIIVNVFLVQTRGTIVGLAAGLIWFVFAYPTLRKKTRIFGVIALLAIVSVMYASKIYLDSHLYIYEKLPPVINSAVDRTLSIFEGSKVMESRLSAWKIAFRAFKDKPILGYGPENFMIAFDKYYDPSLPRIGPSASGEPYEEWFDRAHNFIFDISITTGVPSLLIYLLFFAFLIWKTQKMKKQSPESTLLFHGLQATFLAYLIALFFGFDSVSTYLTFFLIIGYSFHLINASKNKEDGQDLEKIKTERIANRLYSLRWLIMTPLFMFLIFFVFSCNLKPLWLNKEINRAEIYSKSNLCQDGLDIVNRISPQIKNSITDDYLERKSMLVIYGCIRDKQYKDETLVNQAIKIMKEVTDRHPAYVQNWLLLGEFTNLLIEEKNKATDASFVPTEEMKKLKEEANFYLEKTLSLSPKRQIVINELAKTKIITEEYEEAKETLQKCIALNENYAACVWTLALTEGYSGNRERFIFLYNQVKEKGYDVESEDTLKQLVDMYIKIGDYKGIAENYEKLIKITDDAQQKAQLHASLAAAYIELGQIENAKKEAQKILDLIPSFPKNIQEQARKDVEAFLKTLQ